MGKCLSCRKGFNGRNGNGYMPCNCKTKSKIDNTDLNNLLQKAIEAKPSIIDGPEIEMSPAKPKFVPAPAPLVISDHSLFVVYPWKYRACLYFVLGLMVGIVGCLYAASHFS